MEFSYTIEQKEKLIITLALFYFVGGVLAGANIFLAL
jgi:hypothetical protein